jgi:hypothetical protein
MTELTKRDLVEALDEVLNTRRTVDEDLHRRHHEYIEMELEKREQRKANWAKFRSSFIGGMALAVITGLGWIGTLILTWVRHPQ